MIFDQFELVGKFTTVRFYYFAVLSTFEGLHCNLHDLSNIIIFSGIGQVMRSTFIKILDPCENACVKISC